MTNVVSLPRLLLLSEFDQFVLTDATYKLRMPVFSELVVNQNDERMIVAR